MRAILYLRLSSSSDDSTSIVRQEADLRELAVREGWDVVRVLVDDGISGRKARANAAEALRMLRSREADVLAVWKLDRWTRQGLSAVGDLVATLRETEGALFVALRDGLRSDQAAFGIIAAVLSETAKAEADNAAVRIRSSIAHRAKTGRFAGGPIPYGYRSVPATEGAPGKVLVLDPTETEILREKAARLLSGEPLHSVVRSLNEAEVPTPKSPYRLALLRGKPTDELDRGFWHTTTLVQVLAAQYTLGRIVHGGVPVTDDDGLPITFWEPIFDLGTFEALRALLGDPRNPRSSRTLRARSRLLSGLLYCASCDAALTVHYRSRDKARVYTCPESSRECPRKISISADFAERALEEAYLSVVGKYDEYVETLSVDTTERDAQLRELDASLKETTGAMLDDGVDTAALLQRLERLKERRAEILAAPTPSEAVLVPTGRTYAEAWETATDADKRRSLDRVIDHAVVHPADRKTLKKGYDPRRVEVYWTPEASAGRE